MPDISDLQSRTDAQVRRSGGRMDAFL